VTTLRLAGALVDVAPVEVVITQSYEPALALVAPLINSRKSVAPGIGVPLKRHW